MRTGRRKTRRIGRRVSCLVTGLDKPAVLSDRTLLCQIHSPLSAQEAVLFDPPHARSELTQTEQRQDA
jgi:hypothetical protein